MSIGDDVITHLRKLLADSKEVVPYKQDDVVYVYCGKALQSVQAKVSVANHNHPEGPLYVLCSTRGCSCSRTVADLPPRYKVSHQVLEYEAAKALPALLHMIDVLNGDA